MPYIKSVKQSAFARVQENKSDYSSEGQDDDSYNVDESRNPKNIRSFNESSKDIGNRPKSSFFRLKNNNTMSDGGPEIYNQRHQT